MAHWLWPKFLSTSTAYAKPPGSTEENNRAIGSPFTNSPNFTWKLKLQILLMSLTIAPLRAFIIGLLLGLVLVIGNIACIGLNETLHDQIPPILPDWRRRGLRICCKLMVWCQRVAGFRIKIFGDCAPTNVAPVIICAPHTSFWDQLPVVLLNGPVVVGKEGVQYTPGLGRLFRLMQPILVDRDCSNSRQLSAQQMSERAHSIHQRGDTARSPHLFVFPEGTCGNATQLLQFKTGAFAPGLPVQPLILRWPQPLGQDLVSYVFDGLGPFTLFFLCLCRPISYFEMEFLDVYEPNADEKQSPSLFAENVRTRMASALNLPLSPYSLDDLPHITYNLKTPKLEKFFQLIDKISLPRPTPSLSLSAHWQNVSKEQSELQMDLTNFIKFLKLVNFDENDSAQRDTIQRLFNMFDWKCEQTIDVREFLITLHSQQTDRATLLHSAYLLFRPSLDDELDLESLSKIVRLPFELRRKHVYDIYNAVCKTYGRVDFESLIARLLPDRSFDGVYNTTISGV